MKKKNPIKILFDTEQEKILKKLKSSLKNDRNIFEIYLFI